MSAPEVVVTTENGVCTLRLNRPQVRNAMSKIMVDRLLEGLAHAEADDSVRMVVLRGEGGHFCAGGDIQDMAKARQASAGPGAPDPVAALNARFGHLANAMVKVSLPVVAVCEGVVMGGGFGLAVAADITLASPTVDFRLPETGLGIVPAQIAPFLARRLGVAEAQRLALTGARLKADEALARGIVHEVADDVDALLNDTITALRRGGPEATAATKRLFLTLVPPVDDAQIDAAAQVFAKAARGAEAVEGMTAFLQKRRPSWAEES
ncbi:MAG: enoyl-CoA hydratase-related protein [Myxococcota bacterium]